MEAGVMHAQIDQGCCNQSTGTDCDGEAKAGMQEEVGQTTATLVTAAHVVTVVDSEAVHDVGSEYV